MNTPTALVHMQVLTKSFGATQAVRGITLSIPVGEVIGLIGENGAGKSTLAKMIAGVYTPDSGVITFDGQDVRFRSPFEALQHGISMMAQEIMLVPDATVEENIFLGNMPTRGLTPDRAQMHRRFKELMELTEFELEPEKKVKSLRLADQQKVEILRSLSRSAKLIIMDEPSASLTADEVERLHKTIRKIAAGGATVLLISHFLEEVLDLTTTVVIMRDGELIRSGPTSNESVDSLVSGMVGQSLETRYFEAQSSGSTKTRLRVKNLNREGVLRDISFDVHEGEILGLAGLIGAGRTEIARSLFGADKFDSGEIIVDGRPAQISSPGDAIKHGIYMIPEDRKKQGLVLESSITDNMTLSTLKQRSRLGMLGTKVLARTAIDLAKKIDLRYSFIGQTAASLSGGNQQKILFGRAIEVAPQILIVDEPTRGVDIAAKRAIHQTLIGLAKSGIAILFISSEIEEVLGVCDRVLVVHRGRIQTEFNPPFDQTAVVAAFFGRNSGEVND